MIDGIIHGEFVRYLIVALFFMLVGCTENNHPQKSSKIDQIVHAYMLEHDYIGLSIAAIKDNEVVFDNAYGFSDRSSEEKFSSEKVISLGSNTKTLTASAVLLLQERGLLKLSDTLDKYIPFHLKHSEKITLLEMLCHSSDLPDVYGVGKFENYLWQQARSQKEFIDKLNTDVIAPTAGETYRYNNTAYFLLGLVVEHISKQNLGDFFREYIFNYNQANNLYYLGDSFYSPTLTPSFEQDGTTYESPVEYRIVGGAGALAGDLFAYLHLFQRLVSGQVLNSNSSAQMHSVCKFNDNSEVINQQNQKIGLGIEISEINGEKVYSRGGALNGYVSAVYYFPSKNLTIGVIGNTWAPLAPLLEKLFETGWQNEI